MYCPPVPSTLTGFLGAVGQNLKGLLITVTGLIVVVNLGAFMFENLYRNTIITEPLSTTASKQKPLIVGGQVSQRRARLPRRRQRKTDARGRQTRPSQNARRGSDSG